MQQALSPSRPIPLRHPWLRWVVTVAVVAVAAAWLLWPMESDQQQGDEASAGVHRVLDSLSAYAKEHDGKMPPFDQIVPTLITSGNATDKTFILTGVTPAFYYVPPIPGEKKTRQPVIYTNPTLRKDQSIVVGFADQHVETLSSIQSRAFLSSVSTRAVPLK